jgi:multisubunit Na+/H+ antiporter MnhB subunit
MIYIFGATAVYTLIKQRKKLLEEKRNLILYLFLSMLGLVLGIVYLINPYLPSLAMYMEKYVK